MLNQQLELFLVARSRRSPAGSMPSVAMIRSLRIPREALVNQRTQAINQLRALIVTAPAELRESLAGLTAKQLIERVAHFRVGSVTSPAEASRFAMRQLGRHVLHIDVQVEDLDRQLDPLVAGRAVGRQKSISDRPRRGAPCPDMLPRRCWASSRCRFVS